MISKTRSNETIDVLTAKQVRLAIAEADALVFVVDARDGLLPQDDAILAELRRSGKARYRGAKIGKYQVTKEGWSLVTGELTEARKGASYSEAVESLRNLQEEDPQRAAGLKILRFSEVKSIA